MLLFGNGDGMLAAGPLDVVLIYHHVEAGTYHPAIYLDRPMPGPVVPYDEREMVRLRSDQHHTEGAPTLEAAKALVAELRLQLKVEDSNVDVDHPLPWDGRLGDVLIVPNWRKRGAGRTFSSVLANPT
jgi:hypothetical protein